jgi:hypothetical protein
MPTHPPLAPQIEQFIHDNPQGVGTSPGGAPRV